VVGVVSFGGVMTTEAAMNSVPLSWVHGRKVRVNVVLLPAARVTFLGVTLLRISDQLPPEDFRSTPGKPWMAHAADVLFLSSTANCCCPCP
jgi:hypothetical protein